MLRLILFNLLLVGSCSYALWKGRRDERTTALVCLGATAASYLMIRTSDFRYVGVELGVLIVDALTLAAFIFVALRSDRFWPLWVSGLQLTTSVAHLLKALQPDLVPIAYAAAGRLWSYPILVILIIGTWRVQSKARWGSGEGQEPHFQTP